MFNLLLQYVGRHGDTLNEAVCDSPGIKYSDAVFDSPTDKFNQSVQTSRMEADLNRSVILHYGGRF